jgi:hypothetical protein
MSIWKEEDEKIEEREVEERERSFRCSGSCCGEI